MSAKGLRDWPALQPLGDRVIVKPLEEPTETASGLYLGRPKDGRVRPRLARVIAVGPGHRLPDGSYEPLSLTPGVKVYVSDYRGSDFVAGDGSTLWAYREADILAIISL